MSNQDQGQGLLSPFQSKFCMLCAYARPNYQVSVYRTIVPLVIPCRDTSVSEQTVVCLSMLEKLKTDFSLPLLLIKERFSANVHLTK